MKITNKEINNKTYELMELLSTRNRTTKLSGSWYAIKGEDTIEEIGIGVRENTIYYKRIIPNLFINASLNVNSNRDWKPSDNNWINNKHRELSRGSLHKHILDLLNKEYPNHTFELLLSYQKGHYNYKNVNEYILTDEVALSDKLSSKKEVYAVLNSLIKFYQTIKSEEIMINNFDSMITKVKELQTEYNALLSIYSRHETDKSDTSYSRKSVLDKPISEHSNKELRKLFEWLMDSDEIKTGRVIL